MPDPPLAALKVAELLKEVQIDYSTTEAIESGLDAIRAVLQQIPEQEVSVSLADAFIRDLGVSPDKAKLKFRKPDVLEVVGSFASKTVTKPIQNVDLAIGMPKKCFHQKDFLNYRYHAKRALYLAMVRKHLMLCNEVRNVEWALLYHDPRKPTLLVHLAMDDVDSCTKYGVQIIPIIGPDVFDVVKLAPNRNNVRDRGVTGATPFYNSSILEDIYIREHCSFLVKAFSQFDSLRDGIALLKVWMRQRGFLETFDSLNGFLMSMLLVHLTTDAGGRQITCGLTGLQMFRICLEAIANGDLLGKGLYLESNGTCKVDYQAMRSFNQSFDIIMCDMSGCHNMAFRMTTNALEEIKEEASCTLAAMKGRKDHGFEEAFMTAVEYATKYDYHIRISAMEDYSDSTPFPGLDKDSYNSFERHVESLLCKGFGNRVRIVRVARRSLPSDWTIEKGIMHCRSLPVFVGLKMSNFETAFRMVDIGPGADDKKAAEFRTFWGPKAELRRFKDGTIAETAVWECEPWQRHLIIGRIAEHVLSRHLTSPIPQIDIVAGQLDFALMDENKDPIAVTPKLLETFEEFAKKLRCLEDLPLKISSIQPLSPAFRHSAVFPPQIHPLAREGRCSDQSGGFVSSFIHPLEVMLQLEGSGKWPSNAVAIEKTKVAFCLKIAESMQRLHGAICIAAEDAVDLLIHGFCFRLKVHYEKDTTLVNTMHDQVSLLRQVNRQPVKVSGLTLLPDNDLLLKSLHAGMLNGLQGRCPLYGPTVRLAKRWVCSHLFSGVLGEEAVELLVAHVFLKPAPFSIPSSRITGFLRFLLLLASHDWALTPLVVDINGDFSSKDLDLIMDHFNEGRNSHVDHVKDKIHASFPAMYIATPYDMKSLTWTQSSPSSSGLMRIVAYAKSSAKLLKQLISGEVPDRWQSLFRTPLHLYDILLLLQRNKLPFPNRALFPAVIDGGAIVTVNSMKEGPHAKLPFSILHDNLQDTWKQLLLGFDPTTYFLLDLREKLGKFFNFWHDSLGGEVIGLTWIRPHGARNVKVHANKRKRVENDGGVPDLKNVVVEIGEIGAGYLKSIHIMSHSSKWI